jgi:hypothetical protein
MDKPQIRANAANALTKHFGVFMIVIRGESYEVGLQVWLAKFVQEQRGKRAGHI